MSEPVFFKREGGLTIEAIVALTGARPLGNAAMDMRISDIASHERAGPGDVTFAEATSTLRTSQGGACFVRNEDVNALPTRVTPLVVDDPFRAFVLVAAALYPNATRPSSLFETRGTAANALVHPAARIEAGVTIDPAAVIGPRAEIGSGTVVGPMAVIGPEVRIGRDCSIGAGASLTNALLGDRVVISAGCRIGQGDAFSAEAGQPAGHSARLGRVILQDRVEIGANCTIDRGGYRDTQIGEGTRVDNLVHIVGDVMIGRFCRIAIADDQQTAARAIVSTEGPLADGVWIAASAVRQRNVAQGAKAIR